jgi:hypothetical protein
MVRKLYNYRLQKNLLFFSFFLAYLTGANKAAKLVNKKINFINAF